jgi:DNA excision repair protein ERCC-4
MTVPIVTDTREQKPYEFPGVESVIKKALNVGDYTLQGFEDRFAVERKTLNDLATSMGSDRERFEREMVRAQDLDHFAVVIEAEQEEVADYAGTKACPNYYSAIYPNSILGTIEKWPAKYETLEFNWAGSRAGGKQETLAKLDKWYLEATNAESLF